MLYLDTSLLVTAMTPEPATASIQDWLDANARAPVSISEWVATEFAAALSMKVRDNRITAEQRLSAMAQFARFADGSADVITVSTEHFRIAARFAESSPVGLRAGDALHLAIASSAFAKLYTRDRRLAEAGKALAVVTGLL